jgi:glucose/arabinose dehydrogenase
MCRPFFLAALLPLALTAQEPTPVTLELQPWANGLDRITDIAHAGDERLFCTLLEGEIMIVADSGVVLATPFMELDSVKVIPFYSEQGLLGMAFHPNYQQNGFFYLAYTPKGFGNESRTRISRFQVTPDPNVADPTTEFIIYEADQPYTNHNGGDIAFGPDGYLYIPLGDGGSANDPEGRAQDLSEPLGDILRIDVDGGTPYAIPADNPWLNNGDTLPEIWASGLRNPWRFGFDALTGDLWIGDVGQDAWEEVDFWPAGSQGAPNFGWRCREGLVATPGVPQAGCGQADDYVSPVSVDGHSNGYCSVIGGRVYRGEEFERFQGRYFYTDYCTGVFWSLMPDGQGGWTKEMMLESQDVGLVVLAEGADNSLYVGNTDDDRILKLKDPCPQPRPVVTVDGNVLNSTVALAYYWYQNGVLVPGANGSSYEPTANGNYYVVAETSPGCLVQSDVFSFAFTNIERAARWPLTVAPVPAQHELRVEVPVAAQGPLYFTLHNAFGEQVGEWRATIGSNTLALGALASGSYTLRLMDEDLGVRAVQRVALVR